jgi:CDP-glycerol glycerophosphotransferase (TagB/SpsB family)
VIFFRRLIKKFFIIFIQSALTPFKYIIRKKRVVILQSRNKEVYCDNTKYLYEFLSNKKDIDAYWVTNNAKIKKYITSKGWRYISWDNPFQMIWVALRAKIVLDNGSSFFNIFNISSLNQTVKISLFHGTGPKITVGRFDEISTSVQQILNINKFDYVNFTSDFSVESIAKRMYFLPDNKILKLGYPRCDLFFDKGCVENAYQDRIIAKTFSPAITKKDKIILYTPTWRPYKYNFPIIEMPGFSMSDFNEYLQLNNLFFFYTLHTNRHPKNLPNNLNRIIFINPSENPLFDINEFMMEVDILLNDYSTTSTDFSILNRPQIFFMPDYDLYNSTKFFVEPYREILPGDEVCNYEDFLKTISYASLNTKNYINKHSKVIKLIQEKYYDTQYNNSTAKLYDFICDILPQK